MEGHRYCMATNLSEIMGNWIKRNPDNKTIEKEILLNVVQYIYQQKLKIGLS